MKEQQAREEMTQQKEELERRMIEYQEEASRAKEALVNARHAIWLSDAIFAFLILK